MNQARPNPSPAQEPLPDLDLASLANALGSPAGLASLTALAELLQAPRPDSLGAVRAFLDQFRRRLLDPVELPAIRDAYHHASRGNARGLLELDRALAAHYGTTAFAQASRHVGRLELRRLRPLRDRTLQRYLQAVEAGEATGWHVVVFGLLLALFSFPLRQGLAHYATRTQESLVESATTGLPTTPAERERLLDECVTPIAEAIRLVLPATPFRAL